VSGKGRVLITGGAGFIGCHSAVALLDAGYEVRVLDALLPPVHSGGAAPTWLPTEVELVVGDVRSKEDLAQSLEGVQAVLHLAAYQDYLPDFSTFFHVNTVGTAMIYEVAVEKRLELNKIVVASSQAVYGEAAYECPEHGRQMPASRAEERLRAALWETECPICAGGMRPVPTDESAVSPNNQYAISKYTQELVAFNLGHRYRLPTTCLRYSIVQGPWQSFHNAYSGICRIFAMRVLAGRRPIAFEDGGQLRDYVSVEDVARANLLALESAATNHQVFNVGGADRYTVLEYGIEVARTLGADDQTPEVPGLYRFGDTRHVFSDSTRLSALGWSPTLGVPAIIGKYVEWASSQPDAEDHLDESLSRMLALGTLREVRP
jgi:dTDP-L-rhamnose 4-epimerase